MTEALRLTPLAHTWTLDFDGASRKFFRNLVLEKIFRVLCFLFKDKM